MAGFLSSLVSNLVSSAPIHPKVGWSAFSGGVSAATIDLVQTYAPHAHLPSQGTITLLVTAVMGIVAYLVPSPKSGAAQVAAPAAADAPAPPVVG